MGQEDLYQTDFYDDKNRFADLFNGVLFKGEQIMKAEDLEIADSVMVSIANEKKGKKVLCDKIRLWKGRYVSIMILESQAYVDYRMVLRVMENEVVGYDNQRKEAYIRRRENKEKFDKHEYLSRMKKEQKYIPIITLVIYVGRNKIWDGEKSLYGILEINEEIKPFVNDFKLNLFDYHDYEDFDMFQTENRFLFEMLSCSSDKKKMIEIFRNNPAYRKLDRLTTEVIFGILKIKVKIDKYIKEENGKEIIDMCQAFEDYKEEGKCEGKRIGKREGKFEGELYCVKNLMKAQNITFEKAVEILGIPQNMHKKLMKSI